MIIRSTPLSLFCAALVLLTSACCLGPKGGGGGSVMAPPSADARPALARPKGLKFTPLFDEKVADPDQRFQRLEGAVQSVRNDLDTLLPLTEEMEALPAVSMSGSVIGVRIADHPDKTRLVLDMTAAPDITARIESKGRKLVIPLPGMNWKGQKSWEADSAQLISGYRLEDGVLSVDLMYAAQIKILEVLPPGPQKKNYRLVIDLFSPEVHK